MLSVRTKVVLWAIGIVCAAIISVARAYSILALLLFCAAAFAILLVAVTRVQRRIDRVLRKVTATGRDTYTHAAIELHAMHSLMARFPECNVPTTRFSIRFANLHAVIREFDLRRPQRIVEFGSGLSTLCIAAWLKREGRGELVSFDHDERWAQQTRENLRMHGLEDFAEVRVAPLRSTTIRGAVFDWYDADLQGVDRIDALLVDGPPSGVHPDGLSRLPALEVFADRLTGDRSIILLDDYDREAEQEIARQWTQAYPDWSCRAIGGLSRMALLEREEVKKVEDGTSPRTCSDQLCGVG